MVKLNKNTIRNMVERGLENTTDHDLSAESAYTVFEFREKAALIYKETEDKRPKLVKEAGIEDAAKFDERRKELNALPERNEEEQKELDGLNAKFNRFQELFNAMLSDEVEFDIEPLSFKEYHVLENENKQTSFQVPSREKDKNGQPKMLTMYIDFFTAFRSVLKNVLWVPPTKEE